jgi:hypothetical protein
MSVMTGYDLCLAWNWEYDADFAYLVHTSCNSREISLLQITAENLEAMLSSLDRRQVVFRAFLDRAGDDDLRFMPFVDWARAHSVYRINPFEDARRAWNKAAMHSILNRAGLYTPYTLVLPSYRQQPDLGPLDLSRLGQSFIIKPAGGGGGKGVVTEACSLDHVLEARQSFPDDQYLLQAHVVPASLAGRPAWFRVIHCAGQVYPSWWDTGTHVYIPVTAEEECHFALGELRQVVRRVADLCRLELFSTEIALTPEGRFVLIDYVNDPVDLRLQSKAEDGVPDRIVQDVAERLAWLVGEVCHQLCR